jgi:hypothetical protein
MASKRMISKSISLSLQVNSMTLLSQHLFTWMIPHADDYGRMTGNPAVIRAMVMPMCTVIQVAPGVEAQVQITNEIVDSCLDEMASNNLIVRYTVGGEAFLAFPKWEEHQTLSKRAISKIPVPPVSGGILENPGSSGKILENPGSAGETQDFPTQFKLTEGNLTNHHHAEGSHEQEHAAVVPSAGDDEDDDSVDVVRAECRRIFENLMPGTMKVEDTQLLDELMRDHGPPKIRDALNVMRGRNIRRSSVLPYLMQVLRNDGDAKGGNGKNGGGSEADDPEFREYLSALKPT